MSRSAVKSELPDLALSFASAEDFRREYAANILNGGIFVASEEPLSVRDSVLVRIDLVWRKESLRLPGEVVHVISKELAAAGGGTPGVAVQLETPVSELRARLEPFLADAPEPEPEPKKPGYRDRAPRGKARVRARVHCPGYTDIEGRTRDLSSSGVLVSVGGDTIDIGEPVQVFITNPTTGEEREILGRVARHVEGQGGSTRAIGIQFYMSDSERKSVERFLKELTAAEHSRHLGGIQGTIEELGLANLLQTLGMAAPEGTLDVISGAEEGYIAFENGQLRAVRIGNIKGAKALARMLAWDEGCFEFQARIDRELPADKPIAVDAALLGAAQLTDESSRVDRASFPPEATLSINRTRRDASAGSFTNLEEAILDLAATRTTVQRMLDIIPETDAEIYMALANLVNAEVLRRI
jgi:Tfp pilus assembly protein PilZ